MWGYVLVIVGIILITALLTYISISASKGDWTQWPVDLVYPPENVMENTECKLACDPTRQVVDLLACKCNCKAGYHMEGTYPNIRCEQNEPEDLPNSVPMITSPDQTSLNQYYTKAPDSYVDSKVYYGGPATGPAVQTTPGEIFGEGLQDFPCVPKCQYGTCVNQRCVCQPGYDGVGCEGPITEYWCPGHKCYNTIDPTDPKSCKCMCPEGVSGEYCTIINETDSISCNSEFYRKYPGLSGVWGGNRCLQTRQNCPIEGNKTLVCKQIGSEWFVQDALGSSPSHCFIGDEYDGFSIGDLGRVGDRCLRGTSKNECENIINKINCY